MPGPQSHLHPYHVVLPPEFQPDEKARAAAEAANKAQNSNGSSTMPPTSLSLNSKLPLLHSPYRIPQIGFGIYQSPPSVAAKSCITALRAGYRHIDSAQFYANESEMGQAVRDSGIPRAEVFLTTKILAAGGSPQKTYEKCLASVEKIDGKDGYVDLFLIHSASPGKEKRKEMWQALERLVEEGKARNIGVSNFGIGHIEELKSFAKIWPPSVNQVEVRHAQSHSPSSIRDD